MSTAPVTDGNAQQKISILPLLKRLWPDPTGDGVTADEVALAVSHIFTDSLSAVQTGALLTCLHFTGWDRRADVLARCSRVMCEAAARIDRRAIEQALKSRECGLGGYRGGLCDIVGTGGDSHNTYNVSTTASVVASALLRIAKHGNRASTSSSGSADLLRSVQPVPPVLEAVTAGSLPEIYERTNYAFLYAPVFHPGMRHVAAVRKELGWRTIFNLLGPLSNPVDAVGASGSIPPESSLLEARLIGVARRDLGETFANALRAKGDRKAMVVCGDEEMDELSPAGPTHCWMLDASSATGDGLGVTHFMLHPSDFGLPTASLAAVSPGKSPAENAAIFTELLDDKLPADDAILNYVLLNTAALFVVSGICDAENEDVIKERGPGGGRWKEGVRQARWAIKSGKAKEMWEQFSEVTRKIDARGK